MAREIEVQIDDATSMFAVVIFGSTPAGEVLELETFRIVTMIGGVDELDITELIKKENRLEHYQNKFVNRIREIRKQSKRGA